VEEGGIELRWHLQGQEPEGRKARNPRTGETVMVPERRVVTFKSGGKMKKRVGEMG
jgi:nucleoid DNA-binding protein